MPRIRFLFLNVGHGLDHLFMLLFPAVAALAASDFEESYATLIALSTGSFIAFGACSIPAGWLGDRWSRRHMITVFFVGIGAASLLTGLTTSFWQIAVMLTLIGVFAAIYHPVGIAMVSMGGGAVGKRLGINGVWGNMGVAVSAFTAGALADLAGWRAAFIVPGVLSILVGLAWHLYSRNLTEEAGAGRRKGAVQLAVDWKRVLAVVAVTTAVGGFIFNSTTVGFPKVLDERLTGLAFGATEVGAIAMMVYVVAAFSQIVVGHLIDRYPIKPVFLSLAVIQACVLYLAITATGLPMVLIAVLVMCMVFGQLPINDTLVARYTPVEWRGRVYAAKYVISLTIAATAVPVIAGLHAHGGGFPVLFAILSVCGAVIALAVLFMPGRGRAIAPAAASGD